MTQQIYIHPEVGEHNPPPQVLAGEKSPEQIEIEIKNLVDILTSTVGEAPDPDEAAASLIEDTGEAYEHREATRPETVAADAVGLDRVQRAPDDSEQTQQALKKQPQDVLREAVGILEARESVAESREEHALSVQYRELHGLDPRNRFVVKVVLGDEKARIFARDRLPPRIERKLGTSNPEEIAQIEHDTAERFAIPNDARTGEAINMSNGEVRRPIMDIDLGDEAARAAVKEAIERRTVGFAEVFGKLSESQGKTVEEKQALLHEITDTRDGLLVRSGVWSRRYGDRLSSSDDKTPWGRPRGTMADLYIDPSDIERYATLDQMLEALAHEAAINSRGIVSYDSMNELTERVASVAELTFPSGVELMHRTGWDSLGRILTQDQLATRATTHHVADNSKRGLNLNGAFVHFTPPGTSAEEYGRVLIGVPIDTIMARTPRLQLEPDYAGNFFNREGEKWSTQEVMGGFTIKQPDNEQATPLVFRKALRAMNDAIARGANCVDIGQGRFDNLSFAASAHAQTAAQYSYPLAEIHAYTENPDKVDEIAARYPESSDQLYAMTTSVVGLAGEVDDIRYASLVHAPLREVALPNFSMHDGPLKVYAPIYSEEVPFAESTLAGNYTGSQLELSLRTTMPESLPRLGGKLVDAGEDPGMVFEQMVKATNNKHLKVRTGDFLMGYLEGKEKFHTSGITHNTLVHVIALHRAEELLRVMPSQSLNDDEFRSSGRLGMSREDVAELTQLVGDRLFAEDTDAFLRDYQILRGHGYTASSDQEKLFQEYQEEQRRQREEYARLQAERASSGSYGLV